MVACRAGYGDDESSRLGQKSDGAVQKGARRRARGREGWTRCLLLVRSLVNAMPPKTRLYRAYTKLTLRHWFYEDYLRPLNPHLPSLSQRQFSQLLIASSPIYPLLAANASASSAATDDAADAVDPAIISVGPSADSGKGQGKGGKGKAKGKKQQQQQQQQLQAQQQARGIDYDAVWGEYVAYKSMVPCCGGIILNEAGDKVCTTILLINGRSCPRGCSIFVLVAELGLGDVAVARRRVRSRARVFGPPSVTAGGKGREAAMAVQAGDCLRTYILSALPSLCSKDNAEPCTLFLLCLLA